MKSSPREEPSCPATCDALCCRYLVKRIPAPRSKYDFDEIYWLLCHEKVAVFVQGRRWHLLVEVVCQHLGQDRTCRIYPRRPYVCRLHSARNCEGTGEISFEEFLLAPQDLVEYMRRRGLSFRVPWLQEGSDGTLPGTAAGAAAGWRAARESGSRGEGSTGRYPASRSSRESRGRGAEVDRRGWRRGRPPGAEPPRRRPISPEGTLLSARRRS